MEFFAARRVYTKVPRRIAIERTGRPPIRVKWVDVNKGSEKDPVYRSRLVAAEVRTEKRDDLYASTPPTEAIRYLTSMAATGNGSKRMMLIDIKRA